MVVLPIHILGPIVPTSDILGDPSRGPATLTHACNGGNNLLPLDSVKKTTTIVVMSESTTRRQKEKTEL